MKRLFKGEACRPYRLRDNTSTKTTKVGNRSVNNCLPSLFSCTPKPEQHADNTDYLKIFADKILFSDLANIFFKSASSAC
ncbi:MAG: hypothetical protein LBJ00_07010 [Planctomycetaceae bacterium]|nr:hypothetical protein [Planctomycetaceae bacterium]